LIVRLCLSNPRQQFDERQLVINVSCCLGKRAGGKTSHGETLADDGDTGHGNACCRQRYGAADSEPPDKEKRGREYGSNADIRKECTPQLLCCDPPKLTYALVVKEAVSSTQELSKIERPDLLRGIAIGK
jgi:hypothetical protein